MQEYEKSVVNFLDYYLCQIRSLPMLLLMNNYLYDVWISLPLYLINNWT